MEQIKEFFYYFFGKGDVREFHYFSLAHILPLVFLGIVIFLIFKFKDKLRNCQKESTIRLALAFTLIICEMSYYWRLIGVPSLEPNPVDHLPITVCGWAIIFCSFMLVTHNQTLFDISYFWVFAGTIFALATPTVIEFCGPTRFRYYQFWGEHLLGYIALFYMMFVHKMRPTIKSLIKSHALLAVLAVIAYFANRILGPGANYLFMAEPEDTPSVLDILPPNFWLRAFIMMIVITALFVVAYLPWFIIDKKKTKQIANQEELKQE